MKRLLILLIAVVAFTLVITATSQEQPDPRFRVQVSVSADENIKGLITSYINRELRGLRDVEIVYKNPKWLLQVVALETSTKGGYKSGVALSIVVLEKFDNGLLKSRIHETDQKDLVDSVTSNLYSVPYHGLRVGSEDDLRSICDGIVADFDTKHLEEARRLFEEYREEYRRVLRRLKQ